MVRRSPLVPILLTAVLAVLALVQPLAGMGLVWQCLDGTPCPLLSHDARAPQAEGAPSDHACCRASRQGAEGFTNQTGHLDGRSCLSSADDRAGSAALKLLPPGPALVFASTEPTLSLPSVSPRRASEAKGSSPYADHRRTPGLRAPPTL